MKGAISIAEDVMEQDIIIHIKFEGTKQDANRLKKCYIANNYGMN